MAEFTVLIPLVVKINEEAYEQEYGDGAPPAAIEDYATALIFEGVQQRLAPFEWVKITNSPESTEPRHLTPPS